MKKILFLILTSSFFYNQILSMIPFESIKCPDQLSLYAINGQTKKWGETTQIERTLYLHECKEKGWGEMIEGYEEWKKHQNSLALEQNMRSPTGKFYYSVFSTGNIDFIKDFLSKAPENMELESGLIIIIHKGFSPLIVRLLIERGANYMKEVIDPCYSENTSAWICALESRKALKAIWECDKKRGSTHLNLFRHKINKLIQKQRDEAFLNMCTENEISYLISRQQQKFNFMEQ